MTPGASLQGLPLEAARCVFEFAYSPALYVDPERLLALTPVSLEGVQAPAAQLSQAIAQTVGLPDLEGLDVAQPLHRVALLPRDLVHELAWWMGLRSASEALRKVILHADLQTLAPHLQRTHWSWVFRPSGVSLPVFEVTDDAWSQPVSEWPARIRRNGWEAMLALCLGLPRSIGQRLWLKFPVQMPDVFAQARSAPDGMQMQALKVNVEAAYEAAIGHVRPEWDAQWSLA